MNDLGRLLMIGSLSGWVTKEGIDLQPIVRNRIRIEGSTLKARYNTGRV
jgi:hypothetical protein